MFPGRYTFAYVDFDPLGDVNNDGYDDFCYSYSPEQGEEGYNWSAIILGGTFNELPWRQYDDIDDLIKISACGDVNHDSYDDFIVTYGDVSPLVISNTLFFGSINVIPVDSLVLYSGPPDAGYVTRTKCLGDLNGDGIDDFTGLIFYPNIKVWYGGTNLTTQCNLFLTPQWTGNSNDDRGLVHGDLNNDGFDDVIGSEPWAFGQRGGLRVWLGGTNMNGISDVTIEGNATGMQMGTGLAAGDFNNDGYCDVAAGAPCQEFASFEWGLVNVYAGNGQLSDTTPVEDNVIQPPVKDCGFTVIPNPMSGKQTWKLKLTGKGYDQFKDLTVMIYNLKGQKAGSYKVTHNQIKSGEINLPHLNLPYGIYEISICARGKVINTQKATIR